MAFFQMAQYGADPQKYTGDFVGGQGGGEAEPHKNQDGKLNEAHAAARDRREKIGNDGSDQQYELSGPVEEHGVIKRLISRYYRDQFKLARSDYAYS